MFFFYFFKFKFNFWGVGVEVTRVREGMGSECDHDTVWHSQRIDKNML